MATLQQLRTRVYNLIRESATDTQQQHFATSVIDGYLNEAQEYLAVFIEYPRDLVSVQTEINIGSYPNPSDNLLIRTAYFGDNTIPGDWRSLRVVSEETLKEIVPSWNDASTTSTSDRPQYLIQLDRKTIFVYPRPNAVGSASGKKIWLNYNYVPAAMVNDSDQPDLPVPYHTLLPIYALHLCYYGLQNQEMVLIAYKDFMEKVTRLKSAVTKESKEIQGFNWGIDEGLNTSSFGGVIP